MDELTEMYVVAAAFGDRAAAHRAEAELRSQLDVTPADVAVAEVGGDIARQLGGALLAGRFRAHRKPIVDRVVTAHGGAVIADYPERCVASPHGLRAAEMRHARSAAEYRTTLRD